MSVVVWDGTTIAADRACIMSGMMVESEKIKRLENGTVLAFTGDLDQGVALMEWYENGAIKSEWPPFQTKDDWTRLIVLEGGKLKFYERYPIAMPVLSTYMAFGSGREFAMGAMAMGANSVEAVGVAMKHSDSCGMGITHFLGIIE